MIYTVKELKRKIEPAARKYNIHSVYLFGSYARGTAKEDSDVDILIDRTGSDIKSIFDMGGLYNDLRADVGKEIDIITTQTLEQKSTRARVPELVENILAERIKIYE